MNTFSARLRSRRLHDRLQVRKLFGKEATKIGRQILDQTVTFNAGPTTNWGLPQKPTVTRG